jgi:peroxidase
MSCIVGGIPVPQITWYKNSKSITTRTMTYENRVAKYVIEETTESTAGSYRCEATNEMGKAETTCTVTVGDAPTIEVEEKHVSQTLRVETEWSLVARIRGFPTPDMTLYKDGVKSDALQNLILRKDSECVTITIKSLQRSHSGKYTLEAKNTNGRATVDLTLRVIGKFINSKP